MPTSQLYLFLIPGISFMLVVTGKWGEKSMKVNVHMSHQGLMEELQWQEHK
jgi:hypothetical protein